MLDGVSLDQLRTFIAAAEAGVRRAQSVVSKTLANLEGQIGVKPLSHSARIRYRSLRIVFLLVIMIISMGAHASGVTNESEARALFTKFVAAQNAHSVSGVKAMLWNSPGTLLLARGAEIRGLEAVADRFKEYYEGTWHVEPDMSLFHVTLISRDVMQFLVPVVFTRGLPGQPSQDKKFLIAQTLVHDANGWHIASIISIAYTQAK